MTDFDTKPKREKPKRSPLRRAMLTFAAALIALLIIIIGSLLVRGTLRPFIPSIPTPTLPSRHSTATTIIATGKIAYTGKDEGYIYLIDPAGKNRSRLPMQYMQTMDLLAWSPDNQRILCLNKNQTFFGVLNADGLLLTVLPVAPGLTWMSWSSDGKRIFGSRARGLRLYQLYEVNADGSGERIINPNVSFQGFPLRSPDGQRVAFRVWAENDTSRDSLYVADVDGSNEIKLVEKRGIMFYRWSPDGRKIVFDAADDTATPTTGVFFVRNLFVVDTVSGALIQLTHGRQTASPSWSPDGQRIVFIGWDQPKADTFHVALYTIKADGSDEVELFADDQEGFSSVIWSH
jgi:Tol biopolymer transport system component